MKRTIAQLLAELQVCQDGIDAAYWAFTRQAKAPPPVLAVPDLYARRAALEAALRARRARARARRGARACQRQHHTEG